MIDKFKKTLQQASEVIRDQAVNISDSAKEKSFQLIEDWLQIFPRLEEYGLEIKSFGLGISISPSLEVELMGSHEDFNPERLERILEENKGNTALVSVFTTIKTVYNMQKKVGSTLYEPLIVKVKVKITPEINVYLGEPLIL